MTLSIFRLTTVADVSVAGRIARSMIAGAAVLALASCGGSSAGGGSGGIAMPSPAPAPSPAPTPTPIPVAQAPLARSFVTSADGARRLDPATMGAWQVAAPVADTLIQVDPSRRYQTIAGFGAAISDSSAWLIQRRMSDAQRTALMADLFGPSPGIALGATRLTIGASDFSLLHYSYAEGALGTPTDLTRVEADVLPTILAARAISPQLTVIASPWSAPASMKSSGRLIGGTLNAVAYPHFARYLRDYLVGMAARGVPIDALTIQNEPDFEPGDYPGMRLSAAQRADFVANHLGPLLRRDAPSTQLLEWDHNWDQPGQPAAVLRNSAAAQYIAGVAWHCYAGDVSAQSTVQREFPDKDVWFTECSGGSWDPDFGSSLGWMTRNLIIGTTRNWARGVVMWNIALDENNGPHLGGCGNCRGVVTIDSRNGNVTRNVEYYVLAHASRFVRRGAVRIDSNTGVAGIDSVAFRNSDDGSIVLLVANSAADARSFHVRFASRQFAATLSAGAVATYVWDVPAP
ncbi:MAG: glycoside hydrolase family 30 beta sandwich domain-containing protein [Sphingopyxis sp.]